MPDALSAGANPLSLALCARRVECSSAMDFLYALILFGAVLGGIFFLLSALQKRPAKPAKSMDQPHLADESRHFFLQVLVPEPDNKYDPDAIRVCRSDDAQLGYVPSERSSYLNNQLAIGWTFRVTVDEVFPADRPGCVGCRMRFEVLTMSKRTEQRKKHIQPR